MNSLLNAYINTQFSYFSGSFKKYGIERTMNDFFRFLENYAKLGDCQLIMKHLAENCSVSFDLEENGLLVADSTKMAIMEAIRTRMREILPNFWKGRIEDLERHNRMLPMLADNEIIERYKTLLETYDDKMKILKGDSLS